MTCDLLSTKVKVKKFGEIGDLWFNIEIVCSMVNLDCSETESEQMNCILVKCKVFSPLLFSAKDEIRMFPISLSTKHNEFREISRSVKILEYSYIQNWNKFK